MYNIQNETNVNATFRTSVCIPVYNGAAYIKQTVQSVLEQTVEQFELVIVDNASTDNTCEIINGFKDSRIRLVRNYENLVMIGNWNKCVKEANGDYIQVLCADDIIYSTCLEEKIDILLRDENIKMVISSSDVIDGQSNILFTRRVFRKDKVIDGKKFARWSFRTKNLYGEPSCVMFRRKDFLKSGGFPANIIYGPDWAFWIRLGAMGNIAYLSKAMSAFRIEVGTTSSKLMKDFSFLKKDDKELVNYIKGIKIIKINFLDILIHNVVFLVMYIFKKYIFSTRKK